MALDTGTRFGSYEIADAIGAGGMGEVYRAKDTTLERDVAIKVLPESFASDTDRVARFEQEAKTLASLNHPNIAQVHGLERSDGTTAIVMELVDGPTLADRIAEGPLPADEALNIAMQIADGLEAAHEQGIVHRDLKPANVKLRPDGIVKILDFGIAKAFDPQALTSGPQSPVMTTPVTQAGVILGTAAYMSPEQARGKQIDQRTDIWAFGCVLFEMLTGQPVFGGEDVTITLARVVDRDSDLSSLPGTISAAVRRTIELCLQKDPAQRVADIRDVRLAIAGAFETKAAPVEQEAIAAPSIWGKSVPVALALIIGVALTAAVLTITDTREQRFVNRFDFDLPDGQRFRSTARSNFAISPNGRHIAYLTPAGLHVKGMDERVPRLIAGTEGARGTPFFSADSQSVAAFGFDAEMRRVSINGGATVAITDISAPFGASWGEDGVIVYGLEQGIMRVSENGGTAELIVPTEGSEAVHGPQMLPDGDSILFTLSDSRDWDNALIVVDSLASGERTVLVEGGRDARYLPTGHIVYVFEGTLWGVGFDAENSTVSDGAVPLVQGLTSAQTSGSANYGVSNDGTLAYISGGLGGSGNVPVWVDRSGREEGLPIEPGNYGFPRISPDGTRLVLDEGGGDPGVWVYNFADETRNRMTLGAESGDAAIWSIDGTRIAFSVAGEGDQIGSKAANNTGTVDILANGLLGEANWTVPLFFSPSGDELVYMRRRDPDTSDDLGMVSIGGDAEPVMLLNEVHDESSAALSPNGRWMAYQSQESNRNEIYVSPFPNVDDDRIQVSNNSGVAPVWSWDGRELFYIETQSPDSDGPGLISVAVESTEDAFAYGERTRLFDYAYQPTNVVREYDVSLDGDRFIVLKNTEASGAAGQIVIVQNFFEELRRLVPTD